MPSNLSNFLLQPISQSQKNNLNLISKCEYNFLENEQTASARKRIHDQVVKVSCNNGDTGAQGSSDDNKKARSDNIHNAHPESTGLAAEALPVCSPDNQEQSETSAIVLENVTISLKDVQSIIEFNKNGVTSDIITKFVGYSEEIVDQIISEHEKTADIRKRQHDQTVNTNCNNRDTGAQGSSDDNKKAKYDNTHSAYPESTGLAAEALPVCSPDNQEQSKTSSIVLENVTISPKDVQTIIEFNKNGVPSDIITKFVGYSEEIVDQIISEHEKTADIRKRQHDRTVNTNCNNRDTGAQCSSDDNKKARYDNTHSAYPESTGLAAEALPVCSPDNQEQSKTSAIVLENVTISPKDVQSIIEFNKNGVTSDIITKFVGYSEEIVDQIISEHEKTADIRKRQHDQTVNTNCNNRDTGAQCSSDDNKKARYGNTHSAYPESTGLAAEALPVCSPDNQEQSKTSAIVLENVTISPKDVQYIIESNKKGSPADIIATSVGYSKEIVDQIEYIIKSNKKGFPSHVIAHILDCSEETVDQIIREQDNNEVKEPINPDKKFQVITIKSINRETLKSIVEYINEKISCEEIIKKTPFKMKTIHTIIGWFYQKEICTIYHENEGKTEDIAEKFYIKERAVYKIVSMVYRNNESRENCIKVRGILISKKIVKTIEEDIKNGMSINAIARKKGMHSSGIKKVAIEYLKPEIYAMIKNAKMPLAQIAKKYGLYIPIIIENT